MKITADFTRLQSGESLSRRLFFSVEEELQGKKAKLGFITPRGNIYFTGELSYENGEGEYLIPSSLTDGRGILVCQLYVWDDTGFIAKSPLTELPVGPSVDSTESIPVPDEGLRSLALVFDYIEAKADREHSHGDVYYTKDEVDGLLSAVKPTSHNHNDLYYTKAETDTAAAQLKNEALGEAQSLASALEAQTETKLSGKSDKNHEHDDRYPTKSAVMASIISTVGELEKGLEEILAGKSDTDHTHHDLYYTEAETDNLISQALQSAELLVAELSSETDVRLSNKSDKNHSHGDTYISAMDAAVLIGDAKEEVLGDAEQLVIDLEAQTETKLSGKSDKNHSHHDLYYTEAETDNLISQAVQSAELLVAELSSETDVKLSNKSDKNHSHGDAYISAMDAAVLIGDAKEEVLGDAEQLVINLEAQTETKLSGKSNKNHTHHDLYYTEAETDNLISQAVQSAELLVFDLSSEMDLRLGNKSDKNHTHGDAYISVQDAAVLIGDAKEEVLDDAQGLVIDLEAQTETKLAGKSNKNHNHHDVYYTEAETDGLISQAENRAALLINDVQTLLSAELGSHNHDNRYYTKEQSDNNLLSFRDTAYALIMQEINGKLSGKSNTTHTHRYNDLTEAPGDYVMDQNAGAGWYYRLWDSGIVELWGNFSLFHNTTVAAGGGFSVDLYLPFSLTDTDYSVFIQPAANAEKIKKTYPLAGTESVIRVYIKLESSADGGQSGLGLNETVGLNLHVIGRWR